MTTYTVHLDASDGANGSNTITCDDERVLEGVLAAFKTCGIEYNETTQAWVVPMYETAA